MNLKEAVESFRLAHESVLAETTLRWYERRLGSLVAFLGEVAVGGVGPQDLRRWRADLHGRAERYAAHPTRGKMPGGLAPHTLHGYVRAVRHFFRWLVADGVLSDNPAGRLGLPKLPKAGRRGIGDGDMVKMLEAGRGSGARDFALLMFLASTACRCAGAASLRVNDVDLVRGCAIVCEKGDREREVYLAPAACEALGEWLKVRPEGAGPWVFVGSRGKMGPSGVYQVLKRLARAAGVEAGWNPHNWRHAAARRMLLNGASLAEVSQILGHASVEVTADHYGIFAREELRRSHAKHIGLPSLPDVSEGKE